jgi:hypothetical protein
MQVRSRSNVKMHLGALTTVQIHFGADNDSDSEVLSDSSETFCKPDACGSLGTTFTAAADCFLSRPSLIKSLHAT